MTSGNDILFIHSNFPGQYKLLARHLARLDGLRVFAIGSQTASDVEGVRLKRYRTSTESTREVHPFAQRFEIECRRAERVIYAANVLKLEGMSPRIIFVHPGWGESLPLRQLFPDAKICVYCEFYYSAHGTDIGFDPEFQGYGVDGMTRIELRNAASLLALVDADRGIAPTRWQRSVFPAELRSKIRCVHDGLDITNLQPGPARFSHPILPREFVTGDEVLTFVARGLEPYRGFHVFMRSLPKILAERPDAQVCIVGGPDVCYGSAPVSGGTWKNVLLQELNGQVDLTRVHFLDRLPYHQLLELLRVSRAHVYMTYPFVLSWSLLEAMALGCTVIASDVAPVREVITDRQNGLLVPFFEKEALAAKITEVLAFPERFERLRSRASATISAGYSFERSTFPQIQEIIAELDPEIGQLMLSAGGNSADVPVMKEIADAAV